MPGGPAPSDGFNRGRTEYVLRKLAHSVLFSCVIGQRRDQAGLHATTMQKRSSDARRRSSSCGAKMVEAKRTQHM